MKYYITKSGYENLYAEYLKVDTEIAQTNKLMGESVKRDNDLRENPEFMELRVKVMYELPAKKKSLWDKWNTAIVIEDTEEYKNFDGKTVIRGCRVKINIDDEECEYQIKGSDEGNINEDILSCETPLAQAILGKKVGAKLEFNNMNIEILAVKRI